MRSPDAVRFVVHADRPSITAMKRRPQNNERGILMCVVPLNVGAEPHRAIDVGLFAIHRQTRGSSRLERFDSGHSSSQGRNATDRSDQIARSRPQCVFERARDRIGANQILRLAWRRLSACEFLRPIHVIHSNRSTVIGSIFVARLAGSQQARTTASKRTTAAVTYAVRSNGLTP